MTVARGGWVTIYEIARRAGVSPSTVSRVLNGSAPVAAAKREAVLRVAESLQYRPNVLAQGLARGRFRTVGVLTQDILSNFYGQILKGIELGLRETNYYPVFASNSSGRPEEAGQMLELLIGRRVDAIVVVGGEIPDEKIIEASRKAPLVAIGRYVGALTERCLSVENVAGGRQATRHLIELGHRRIVHITGRPFHRDATERIEGYKQALSEAGLPVDARLIVEGDFVEGSGYTAVERLLRKRVQFTAIFAGNDQMAVGALLALFRRGVRVPQDVSLVGFDDQPSCAFSCPPLTTVRQPTVEMGQAAAQALVRHLEGAPLRLPSFSTQLVVRESTAKPRGRSKAR
jgi:LacI family transcriptional regulator